MNRTSYTSEKAINVVIISITVLIAGIYVRTHWFTDSPLSAAPETPKIGRKLEFADGDKLKRDKNVILVLQTGCQYCADSARFYRTLIDQAKNRKIGVVAIMPENKEEAERYLNDYGITGIEVKQSQLRSLHVGGTPTIIVTNVKGDITNVWLGKLSPEMESDVLSKILGD